MAAPSPPRSSGSPLVVPSDATPMAGGALADTPLLHLYVYLLDKGLTGTLVLTLSYGAAGAVYVHDGVPTRVLSFDGTIATERGKLEVAAVELCGAPPDARYAFFNDRDLLPTLSGKPVARIEPLAVIMAGARQCVSTGYAETALRKVAAVPSIGIAQGATPERFRLSPEEGALVGSLRKQRASLAELPRRTGLAERTVRAVIYGLTITRHLDFGTPARPPVGTDRPPTSNVAQAPQQGEWSPSTGTTGLQYVDQTGPVPDSRRRAEAATQAPPRGGETQTGSLLSEKRRLEIEAKLASAPKEDHFQLLGVSRTATTSEVRKAYFGLAQVFHPDKVPKDHELRPKVQALFSEINKAYEELSDEGRRAAYLTSLDEPSISQVVNAVLESQKAEMFLKTNSLVDAERHARLAVKADPEQPSYIALLAWIRAQQRPMPPMEEGKTSPIYDDVIAELDAVLKKEPDFERALFYRAKLLKHSGRMQRAIKDFRRVVELNPNNIEAAREVRLYDMRNPDQAGGKNGDGKGGGILNKLFKR